MPMGNCSLGNWCPVWIRRWAMHWYWEDGTKQLAGEIQLLWWYRRTKRQRTWAWATYSPGGDLVDSGSGLSLTDAKKQVRKALSAFGTNPQL